MTRLRSVYEIARRDFVQRAKSKAFLITTLVTVSIVLGLAPLVAFEFRDPPPVRVGISGDPGAGFEAALPGSAEVAGLRVTTSTYSSLGEAEEDLRAGRIDVLLVDGSELVWAEDTGPRTRMAITGAVQAARRSRAIAELGLTAEEAARVIAAEPLDERVLIEPDPGRDARMIGAQVGTFVLYMTIIMFGQFVVMGVLEEKQNRVVEVVLSRVPPTDLLAGKIIGIGLLGLAQIVVLGGSIALAGLLVDLPDVPIPEIGLTTMAIVAGWYVLGYGLFSAAYGALGATVSRQEDVQGAVMIPTLLVIPGFFLSIIALNDPDVLLVRLGSLFPFTAPMVMPVRIAAGSAAAWEIALAVGLILATIVLTVRAAARVYTGAVLSVRRKVRLREAWRTAAQ